MGDISTLSTALANSALFQELQGINDKLAGSGGGGAYRRISIKGGKFRQYVGGEQIAVTKDDNINIVIIDAAPIARTYYSKAYDPNEVTAPTCWSGDTKTPDASVPAEHRQSDKCATCPMAIKGSGQGESRACRFSQRLAVVLENSLDEVYQIQLPATSVFGESKDGKMPMQAYAKFLNAHKAPAIAVYTNMYFDENSEAPKLFFKATRPLTEQELEKVAALRETEEVKAALDMTVSQTDGVPPTEAPAEVEHKAKPKQEVKKAEVVDEDEGPIAEPTKVTAKSDAKPSADIPDDLGSIIDEWDD